MTEDKSRALFARAQRCIAGGVNSPVRSFRAVGEMPRFIARGEGAEMIDVDGNRYIDYVCSWGALILGHADAEVVAAVAAAAGDGLGYGAPTEREVEFAEMISARMPAVELSRAVSSGTEATMSAIRLARGFSGRERVVKFAGCYHGHSDCLLVAGGSGMLTLGLPSCAGVPAAVVGATAALPYNDAQAVWDYFRRYGDETAAVIVEPIAGNMNLVRGSDEFLGALRACCDRYGAVLIFDEVMSGFRVAAGGAQALCGVRPDLTCLGKVVGGGLNVAVFGGRADIMRRLAPEGDVYQAGTLSGNPVALAAGVATLRRLDAAFYERLSAVSGQLCGGLRAAAEGAGVAFSAQSAGGMFGIYFRSSPPADFAQAQECDGGLFRRFFHAMLSRGVYFAPSAFEAGFVTAAHTETHIATTLTAASQTLTQITQ